jgi:multidrug resistance efflux pump
LDDHVEKLLEEEIHQQNATIVANVAFEKSEQQLKDWREVEGANLATHRQEKVMVNNELQRKTITIERRNELNVEKLLLEKRIYELVNEQKTLEANVSALQNAFAEEKKAQESTEG